MRREGRGGTSFSTHRTIFSTLVCQSASLSTAVLRHAGVPAWLCSERGGVLAELFVVEGVTRRIQLSENQAMAANVAMFQAGGIESRDIEGKGPQDQIDDGLER